MDQGNKERVLSWSPVVFRFLSKINCGLGCVWGDSFHTHSFPIGSLYGIFTYMKTIKKSTKQSRQIYQSHGCYGFGNCRMIREIFWRIPLCATADLTIRTVQNCGSIKIEVQYFFCDRVNLSSESPGFQENHQDLGGDFKYFLFSPLFVEDARFWLYNIFQRGWNHQLHPGRLTWNLQITHSEWV